MNAPNWTDIDRIHSEEVKTAFRRPDAPYGIDGKQWSAYCRQVEQAFDRWVLLTLQDIGPANIDQLVEAVGKSHNFVAGALRRLLNTHRIAIAENARYDHRGCFHYTVYEVAQVEADADHLPLRPLVTAARDHGAERIRIRQSKRQPINHLRLLLVFPGRASLLAFSATHWCDPFDLDTPVVATHSHDRFLVLRVHV